MKKAKLKKEFNFTVKQSSKPFFVWKVVSSNPSPTLEQFRDWNNCR